jgi:hypothetical protein
MAGVFAEIRTDHIPNTREECYLHTILLDLIFLIPAVEEPFYLYIWLPSKNIVPIIAVSFCHVC